MSYPPNAPGFGDWLTEEHLRGGHDPDHENFRGGSSACGLCGWSPEEKKEAKLPSITRDQAIDMIKIESENFRQGIITSDEFSARVDAILQAHEEGQ